MYDEFVSRTIGAVHDCEQLEAEPLADDREAAHSTADLTDVTIQSLVNDLVDGSGSEFLPSVCRI